jgi:carboxypeptidase C (cathepsin A)
MRSAGVAEELQQRHGVELNGIVLVSSILDYQTKGYVPGNDYPYANFLPTYTASAWYHKKLPADLQGDLARAVAESRTFAFGEYLQALVKGNKLSAAERRAVAQKVARFSGLSVEFIEQANLRVSDQRFRKELLRDRGVMIGRLDGRYTALDGDDAGETQEFDPSNHALTGPYSALFLDYIKRELRWESDLPYFTSGRVQPWDYSPFTNRYLNLVENLRGTMARNPNLRVLVANGYYDFATPFGATEYTFDHLGYEPTYRERVTLKYYEGGHMMYIVPSLLRQLKRDIAEFIDTSKAGRTT